MIPSKEFVEKAKTEFDTIQVYEDKLKSLYTIPQHNNNIVSRVTRNQLAGHMKMATSFFFIFI